MVAGAGRPARRRRRRYLYEQLEIMLVCHAPSDRVLVRAAGRAPPAAARDEGIPDAVRVDLHVRRSTARARVAVGTELAR